MRKALFIALVSLAAVVVAALLFNIFIFSKKDRPHGTGRPALVALYNSAKDLEVRGLYLEAQAAYKEIIEKSQNAEISQKAQQDLEAVNIKIIFSPIMTEDSTAYTVKKNDTLTRIAKNFNTTPELIMKANNLPNDTIRVGKRLKVMTAKFGVIIDRSDNTLTLKSNENVIKVYRVSTGLNDSTPLGTFKIVNKIKDPVWYKAGAVVPSGSPENILGSRWLGLSVAGYGIHGTSQPESIGQHVTAGCVRLLEPDIQELYIILPVGAEATIIE